MPNTVLVDTGFLIALFDAGDPKHEGAKQVLADEVSPIRARLVTVWPTVVETCFFLNPRGKIVFLEWIHRGALRLLHIESKETCDLFVAVRRCRIGRHNRLAPIRAFWREMPKRLGR